MSDTTVFLSYRRSTSKYIAAYVFNDLRQHGYDVFWDVSSIDSGEFDRIILNQIGARTHFVVILTPGTLDGCIHPDGSENADDWLRREIERAIDLQRNIVPLLLEGFTFKGAERYLTGKLAKLSRYNALEVPWTYLEEAMQRLRTRYLKMPEHPVALKPTPPAEQVIVQQRIDEATSQSEPKGKHLTARDHFERGLLRFDKGDYPNAIADFTDAIRLDPQYTAAYIMRGGTYKASGDFANADADFSEAIRIQPRHPDAYVGRGLVRQAQGNVKGAAADWQQYLDLDGSRKAEVQQWIDESTGKSRGALSAKQYFERGYKKWKDGDAIGAIADLNVAIQLDPRHDYAYATRGSAHYERGHYDAALDDYNKAIELSPQQASTYKSRGLARQETNDLSGAIADFELYLALGGGQQYGDQTQVERMIRALKKKLGQT
jgi:tetratricopeptide (TPR) repeat protein